MAELLEEAKGGCSWVFEIRFPNLDFRARKKDKLPLTVCRLLCQRTVPITSCLFDLWLRFYKTDYCLTLESDMPDSPGLGKL